MRGARVGLLPAEIGKKMTAIDPHTHIYPEGFIEDVRAGRFGRTASIEADAQGEWLITRGKVLGCETELKNKLTPLYYELEPRFADMERMGVAHQVLSIGPAMTLYTLEAEANKELAASLNDGLTALAREYPDKFSCMATAEALDMPVFVHPTNVLGSEDRLKDFYLRNFIGNPLDTTIAVACLIFGGVMDRFPKLKFYLSHVGGFAPWIRGRWQHGYGERREPKVYGAKDPEEYFGRFYYDTIIHNPDAFEFAAKTLGAERILYGTDYPADMGYHQPAREIPGLNRLSESDQEMILTGNAKRVYGLAI